ncbi:unnamed protein product [Dibothriocephalus latus]|uniref:Uncharacterized protein n=1 Tax=Dibothriocephalus latus TaxID=60516 RepID=A0A3P7LNA2_DIBLA|nr:unnamed protein product [Dibothriocephalus latus]
MEISGKEDPDCAELVDCWPPPLSHYPCTCRHRDTRQLADFITASSNKRVSEVEARCRAQQSRANRLHPLLYAAPNRDDSEVRFSAIFYESNFHLAPEVMETLCNILNCSERLSASATCLAFRDGRTPLLTSVPFRIASKLCKRVMASPSSISTYPVRPLRVDIVACNIYALEQFFLCFLRWLQRLASEVQPLTPLICNALLGRYVQFSAGATVIGSVSASVTNILSPGEILVEQSLLARYLDQIHAAHGGLRKSMVAVITASLMQEAFYRSVYAIEYIRASWRSHSRAMKSKLLSPALIYH